MLIVQGLLAPQREHQWLQKLVGEWTSEADAAMEPGKPPEKFKGVESVRSLGGLMTHLWIYEGTLDAATTTACSHRTCWTMMGSGARS